MKDKDAAILIIILVLAVWLGFKSFWTFFKYMECRSVGHSVFYCIGTGLGK